MTAPQSAPFTIVDLVQGTESWRQWRAGGIGASDAPAIMGENPWKSAKDLLFERRNPELARRRQTVTSAMTRGVMLEPRARAAYCTIRGVNVRPLCAQSRAHEWMRCSLDGICVDTMQAVEIKCGPAIHARTGRSRTVPRALYGQLQHTMAVTGLLKMDFFCYLPDRPPILFSVPRDASYIERLIEKEAAFWNELCA
ncbi:hypothetical protein GCM10009127_12070 [Alteraurantiacibacter aestuarii]|uniref:YqaJ viral recombinase domain-containing protein n=1 Tax=Alteraurantiacibacter aestuarii TaxID=650004 RepID=A0A844ZJZ3_9SPHN|nr:YqaJ viral recombinase family protein [Alteraurantiacibacter aestuarii]MXO87592.1 hypothetical protein [Alteraurantiacibacter aestuarii]